MRLGGGGDQQGHRATCSSRGQARLRMCEMAPEATEQARAWGAEGVEAMAGRVLALQASGTGLGGPASPDSRVSGLLSFLNLPASTTRPSGQSFQPSPPPPPPARPAWCRPFQPQGRRPRHRETRPGRRPPPSTTWATWGGQLLRAIGVRRRYGLSPGRNSEASNGPSLTAAPVQ